MSHGIYVCLTCREHFLRNKLDKPPRPDCRAFLTVEQAREHIAEHEHVLLQAVHVPEAMLAEIGK